MSRNTQTITSKVAELPRDVRERINQWLHEGKSAEAILALLNQENQIIQLNPSNPPSQSNQPDPSGQAHTKLTGLTLEDILAWQTTGYQAWVEERKHLAELEHIRELARAVLSSGDGAVIQEASLQVVAARL